MAASEKNKKSFQLIPLTPCDYFCFDCLALLWRCLLFSTDQQLVGMLAYFCIRKPQQVTYGSISFNHQPSVKNHMVFGHFLITTSIFLTKFLFFSFFRTVFSQCFPLPVHSVDCIISSSASSLSICRTQTPNFDNLPDSIISPPSASLPTG